MEQIGRYRIEAVLGRGAMGQVYRGVDPDDGRMVAVKTILSDLLTSAERTSALKRFAREAEIARSLDHPNIVKVFDNGTVGETAYMAMEYIEGRELHDYVAETGPEDHDLICGLMNQVLDGLHYAHEHGIVHRDIKPANIMVRDDRSVKIMDFGIARVESGEMTAAGTLLGSPSYMSPEQFMGEGIDRRADVFAAGVMLYQLLTGLKPFTGSLAVIMHKILNVTPQPPSAVSIRLPKAFDPVVERAIAKQADGRFASAEDFRTALLAALEAARAELAARAFAEAETVLDEDATVVMSEDELAGESAFSMVARMTRDLDAALAAGLEDEFDADRLDAIRDGLAQVDDVLETIEQAGGRTTADRSRVVVDTFMLQKAVPGIGRLQQLLVEHAPVPGRPVSIDRMDWMECLDVFRALHKALSAHGHAAEARAAADAVVRELSVSALMYSNEINKLLFSPDALEIMRVSADFMRLDILQWALEELGGQAEVQNVRSQTRMFAGQVLRKVNDTIRGYVASQDELARFDVAQVLSDIEELIVIATRIVESDPSGQVGASEGYLRMMGAEIVGDFIDNARGLITIIVDEMTAEAMDPDHPVAAFAGKLKQVAGLYRFSVRLNDDTVRDRLATLTQHAKDRIEGLTDTIRAELRRQRAAGAPDPARVERMTELLDAIYEMADDLGWGALCQDLLAELRDQVLAMDLPQRADAAGSEAPI